METSAASLSLQSELERLIKDMRCGESFTCLGITRKGERCGNPPKKNTRERLTELLQEIIKLLENSENDIKTLLAEASSLVMCARDHQNQASTKLNEWLEGISARNYELPDNLCPIRTSEPPTDFNRSGLLSKKHHTRSASIVETQDCDQLSVKPTRPSLKHDSDDSGLESGDEEDPFITRTIPSKMVRTDHPLKSPTTYAAPRTPQKAAKPASTDSGISMSYDIFDEPRTRKLIGYRDIPESPLADKMSQTKRATAKVQSSRPAARPAATPLQPKPLPLRPKRKFAPFDDPFTKMRNYLAKPLTEDDMKEGYIYGFQLEGCAYTKIGKAAERDNQPSLEAALAARMKEHKKSGRPDLKIVLKKRVPHVKRVEKLIHYHLEAGRMKEQCSCENSKGEKYNHGNHTEWFNNSLDEIYTTVIAWEHWVLSMPYVELQDGRYHAALGAKWRHHLEQIGDSQNGRDIWLNWLCQHVPELPRGIRMATLDNDESIQKEPTAENHNSFIRTSVTGVKSEIKRTRTNLI